MLAALTPSRRLIGAGRHPNPLPAGRAGGGATATKRQEPAKQRQSVSKTTATKTTEEVSDGRTGRGGSVSSSSAAVVSIDSSAPTTAAATDAKSPVATKASKKKAGGSRDSTPKIQNRTEKSTAVPPENAESLFSDIVNAKKALEEKQVAMEDRFKLLESKMKVREATLANREKDLEERSRTFQEKVVEWREEVDTARVQFRTAREAEEQKLRDSARDVFDEAKKSFEKDIIGSIAKKAKTPLSALRVDGVGSECSRGGSRGLAIEPAPVKTPLSLKDQPKKRRKAEMKEESRSLKKSDFAGSTSSPEKATPRQSSLSQKRLDSLFRGSTGGVPREVLAPSSDSMSTSPLSLALESKPKISGRGSKNKKITPKQEVSSSKKRRTTRSNKSEPLLQDGNLGRTKRRKKLQKKSRDTAHQYSQEDDDANFAFA